jgi:ABC-2 type transport system permease protein
VPGYRVIARFLLHAWWLQVKQLSLGRLQQFSALIQPAVMATIAYLIFRHSRAETVQEVVLGAGLLGMWSAALFGSGAAISRQRAMGLLEGLVGAPMPLPLSVLPITVAAATIGLYSMAATFLWCELLFGFSVSLAHPALVPVCAVVTVLTLGVTGLLLSALFFLYPSSQSLASMMEFPIALLSGVLVPVSALPSVIRPLSWILAPMWSIRALQAAVGGGRPIVFPLLMCAGLSVLYVLAAVGLLRSLVDRSRAKARLALTT